MYGCNMTQLEKTIARPGIRTQQTEKDMNTARKHALGKGNSVLDIIYQSLVFGAIVASVWAMILCTSSAVSGPFDKSAGIIVGQWVFGNISVYWDPIIIGLTTVFLVWSLYHGVDEAFECDDPVLLGFIVVSVANIIAGSFLLMLEARASYLVATFVLLLALNPLGWRSNVLSLIIWSPVYFFAYGAPVMAIVPALSFITQWIFWWGTSIMIVAFRETRKNMKVKRSTMPPATIL